MTSSSKAKLVASQEVASVERRGHDSGPDSAVVTQLREEILELKRRLEKCDTGINGFCDFPGIGTKQAQNPICNRIR